MPPSAETRAARHSQPPLPEVSIPDKLYFRIGEVSDLARTKPYVLRYWETEFPTLRPVKSRSGHRLYRRQDVETILEIRRLLYEQGFTIEGARKQLAGEAQPRAAEKTGGRTNFDGQPLKAIKRELETILTILSKKC
jgi:DNA-binding transcriptional MerR regulator